MEVELARIHGKPVILALQDGVAYINGEPEPIKGLTEQELRDFQAEIDGVPVSDDDGYEALLNAIRAAFLARLMSKAVGDDAIDSLTHILDHVHYDVLKYLGEAE